MLTLKQKAALAVIGGGLVVQAVVLTRTLSAGAVVSNQAEALFKILKDADIKLNAEQLESLRKVGIIKS